MAWCFLHSPTILIFRAAYFDYGWQHLLYYLLYIQHRNSTVLMLGSSSRWWQCGGSSSDCRGPQKLDTPLRSLLHHSRFKLRKVFNLDEAFKLPSLLSLCSRMLRRSSRCLRASLGWAGASAGFAVLLCRACCAVYLFVCWRNKAGGLWARPRSSTSRAAGKG